MVTTFVITLIATRFAAPLLGFIRRGILAIYFALLNISVNTEILKRFTSFVLMLNSRLIKSPSLIQSGYTSTIYPETLNKMLKTNTAKSFVVERGSGWCVINGAVSKEYYLLDNEENYIPFPKIIIDVLVGIAIHEGLIESIDSPVNKYIKENKYKAPEGLKVGECLDLKLNDLEKISERMSIGCLRDKEKRYIAANVLHNALGNKRISDYFHAKIWIPLEAKGDARWLLNEQGVEDSSTGFFAGIYDLQKVANMIHGGGRWNDQQIVPEYWLELMGFDRVSGTSSLQNSFAA